MDNIHDQISEFDLVDFDDQPFEYAEDWDDWADEVEEREFDAEDRDEWLAYHYAGM